MNPKITVLTPTYNRAKYLSKLYESLKKQTNKNFEWFIIDDGSIDETKEKVEKWKKDGVISINYMHKENGGKHKALNVAIKNINTILTFIVDSDDWLTEDAIETIEYYYNKYKDNKKIGGFSFLRKYSNGLVNGREFPKDELIDSYINVRINANMLDDKAEVYYTEILKQYQLLVLPSYNEGLPMAILEAISYGIPVVATNVGDISFAVENNINGYLISPHDIEGLKNKIIDVVTKGENNWKKLSENSRTIAIDKFSSEKYMREFTKLYIKER